MPNGCWEIGEKL